MFGYVLSDGRVIRPGWLVVGVVLITAAATGLIVDSRLQVVAFCAGLLPLALFVPVIAADAHAHYAERMARAAAAYAPSQLEPAADAVPDVARAAVLDLLTRVRQHNSALPPAERDPRRLWGWRHVGLSARRWMACAHALADAGLIRIEDDGTWAATGWTLPEIYQAVYAGEVDLPALPRAAVTDWHSAAPEHAEHGAGAVG